MTKNQPMRLRATSNLRTVIIVAVAVFLGGAPGCSSYDELGQDAYDLTIATYAACRTRSQPRMDRVVEVIRDKEAENVLSKRELRWLNRLVELVENDRWDKATRMARQMLENQVQK